MAIDSKLYMHDLDKAALAALDSFPNLLKLREAYMANVDEKLAKIELLSSAIRLSENQMPEIYRLLTPICEKLGIAIPELYYVKSKELNAATGGCNEPYIIITSKLTETLSSEQLASVLAHECGHIACKHMLYHSLSQQLANGLDSTILSKIPMLRRYITPALLKGLLFWDRCSELSADRAAVLCDGNADTTIDVLLRIHGYDDKIDKKAFIQQAMDLHEFVNDSKSNRVLAEMLTAEESHPRMATRAYECYTWAQSPQYLGILDGTYTLAEQPEQPAETEIIAAEMTAEQVDLDAELNRVNAALARYTNNACAVDYAFAVASGIISGMIDALFVGKIDISGNKINLSHEAVNRFIMKYADARGFKRERLKDAISDLEKGFKVAQDNVWKGAGIGVSASNHHLADLAHHPTPLGLMSAIVVQFLRIGTFVNKDGEWHFVFIQTSLKDYIKIIAPAVLTGVLNWLAALAEKTYEETSGEEIPRAIHKLVHLIASTPILIEIIKCADNWFGHLVSDMGGSKNTAGGGMGIPGIFLSLLYEISALPILKDSGLPQFVNELYTKGKLDLRHELPIYEGLGKQTIPVLFNEIYLRAGYFLMHLAGEIAEHGGCKGINWANVVPFGNRTIDRMMMISTMTLSVADTADAAVHAALESHGDFVLFAGAFVLRFNYVAAGRAAFAIVKEISNERKEAQLIHEKMLLTFAKTKEVIEQYEAYKAMLAERVSQYLAEDLEAFLQGFELMNQGLQSGDSDLVIKGNVTIQRVLGREPQFTSQAEFDDLMDSDEAFVL